MWRFRNSNKKLTGVEKEPRQDRVAWWNFEQLTERIVRCKLLMLKHLERIDARLSNRQRKWLFYMCMLCWSGFLFYLLGTAIRKPPASFVLPFVADSSHKRLRQFNDGIPEERSIRRPQEIEMDSDYSPSKINRNDARTSD